MPYLVELAVVLAVVAVVLAVAIVALVGIPGVRALGLVVELYGVALWARACDLVAQARARVRKGKP